MHYPKSSLWWRDSNQPASGITGAVHSGLARIIATGASQARFSAAATSPPATPTAACQAPVIADAPGCALPSNRRYAVALQGCQIGHRFYNSGE